jgi:hypothetical protein
MGNGQPRPQRRATASVELEQLVGNSIWQTVHDVSFDVFARPGGAEAIAFDAQERDLVERVDGPQARVEFETIDDQHWIAEPDVLRPQVAMPVDNAAATTAFEQ